MSQSIEKDLIRQFLDGTISDTDVQRLQRMKTKDTDRFWVYLEVLQERVPWDDKILLRINDHLYIVRNKEGQRIVKCDCGHEYGDYRVNWKYHALVRSKKTLEEFTKIYQPEPAAPEPEWQEIREFYCPSCAAQLSVEVVPPGYPVMFEMLPDLDRFYSEFLGSPLEDESPDWYEDHSYKYLASMVINSKTD